MRGSLEGIGACLEKNFHFMRGLRRHFKLNKSDKSLTACEFVMDRFRRLCILPRNARVSEDVVYGAWYTSVQHWMEDAQCFEGFLLNY